MQEFYVKGPLYMFFYHMKEIFQTNVSVNPGNCKSHVQHFALFNHCWFIRMLVTVARCPRICSEDFMTLSNDFHAIHRFADLQS